MKNRDFTRQEFLGAATEAKAAAFQAIINLVHSDIFWDRTARQEYDTRLKLIKLAVDISEGLNAEESIFVAEGFAQDEFEKRKAENNTWSTV